MLLSAWNSSGDFYHPPQLQTRIVPFAFSRDDENSTICNLTVNAEIEKFDFTYNFTNFQDVNRGKVGYYTVILPSSCSSSSSTSSNGIKNSTFVIIGDFESCPFWSTSSTGSSSSSNNNRFLHSIATIMC